MAIPFPPTYPLPHGFVGNLAKRLEKCDGDDVQEDISMFEFICKPENLKVYHSYPALLQVAQNQVIALTNDAEDKYKCTFALFAVNLFDEVPWFVQKILNEGEKCRYLSSQFLSFVQDERNKVVSRLDYILDIEEVELSHLIAMYAV